MDTCEDGVENSGREVTLTNLRIPGLQVDEIEAIELPVAKELNANVVTIFTGSNDLIAGRSSKSFESDLVKFLQGLRENREPLIFIATIPDLLSAPRFFQDSDPDATAARLQAFNTAIVRQGAIFNASIANLSFFDVGAANTASDGFHPNDTGHAQIAEVFLNVILPQLASVARS